ncbi:hypothetical protein MTO96_003824 [Rhipicephalus appendiculatus]
MVFAHRSQKSTLPQWTEVVHMQEIPYFFGIPFLDSVNYDEEDREVSAEAMRMLTSFARDGKPSDPNGTQWTPFSAEEPHFLWLEPGKYGMTEFYDGDACDIWRKFECPGRPDLRPLGPTDGDEMGSAKRQSLWRRSGTGYGVRRELRVYGHSPTSHVTLYHWSLFRRTFFMSGTESTDMDVDSIGESIQTGNAVAEVLGCANPFKNLTTHPDEVLQCLRKSSASNIA